MKIIVSDNKVVEIEDKALFDIVERIDAKLAGLGAAAKIGIRYDELPDDASLAFQKDPTLDVDVNEVCLTAPSAEGNLLAFRIDVLLLARALNVPVNVHAKEDEAWGHALAEAA